MKSFGLPRRRIIKKNDQFVRFYRAGRRLPGERITVFLLPCRSEPGQVGFTTSRNIRRAVDRNRARRLMREVFRRHQHDFGKAYDFLFLWSGPVEKIQYKTAEDEIMKLMAKIELSR